MKQLKLIGKIAFYVFFAAVLLLVIGLAMAKFSNQVFFLGDRATVWILTDSMEDTIPAQSYIQIRKVDPDEIQVGDVITFYSDDPVLRGYLNTHRVVEISEDGATFITKGDAALSNDKYPARAEAVVGVYEKNLELLSVAGRIFQSPAGLICTFALLAAVTVFTLASGFSKKDKGGQGEKHP